MKNRESVINALTLIIVILMIAIMVTGCSRLNKYMIFMGGVDVDDHQITGNYKYFDGWFMKELELYEDDTVKFNYYDETVDGSMNVIVIDENGDEIYSVSENGKESILTICEDGYYTIKAVGDKHKGSFSVWWEFKK